MSVKSVLNLSCPICTLAFATDACVYSTSCGHIFHFDCLSASEVKPLHCPQCRHYSPTIHRFYLNYDEDVEKPASFVEHKKKIANLERSVEEKRTLFKKLELDYDKYRRTAQCRADDLSELITLERRENNKLQKLLKDTNKNFEKEKQQVEKFIKENDELKNNLQSRDVKVSEAVLQTQNTMLEMKLKFLTEELEKQINKNTELSIDRSNRPSRRTPTHIQPKQQESKGKKAGEHAGGKPVIIRKLPLDRVKYPLENIVVNLAEKMNFKLAKHDIKILSRAEQNRQITLIVKFHNEILKQTFLCSKDHLKNYDRLKFVQISEVQKETLLSYANKKLRGKVFNDISIESNVVYGKKNSCDKEKVIIKSRRHVDKLLNSSIK